MTSRQMPGLQTIISQMPGRKTPGRQMIFRKKRKSKSTKNFADAYFTVEAAFVIPVVLFVFIMLLYLAFYLYDRCVMAQDCYIVSYRQSIEKGGADRAGQEALRSQLGHKLFMLSKFECSSSGGGTILARADASMEPPLPWAALSEPGQSGDLRSWNLGVEEAARRTDPPKDYRRVRRLLYLAGKAGGRSGPQ